MTARFSPKDGTGTPETGQWSAQETAAGNPGEESSTRVFSTPDKTNTPANVLGWTVQGTNGSDQSLVKGDGVTP